MKMTRDEALPFIIEERTEWLRKEAKNNRENIGKIWTEINDLDAIRKRSDNIPDILTRQNTMSGEFDDETRKYLKHLQARLPKEVIEDLKEMRLMKKIAIGGGITAAVAALGHLKNFFI